MDRRMFLGTLAGGLLAAPLAAKAQQAERVWRIGYLSPAQGHNPIDEAFEHSMRDLGYIEGRNLQVERRYTAGHYDQFAGVAADLVRLNVDLVVVWTPPATLAVKNATSTIPVVFLGGGDVIENRLVANLARPGGNLTGITNLAAHAYPKLLEILNELVPRLSHAAILRAPVDDNPMAVEAAQSAARSLGIRLSNIPLRGPEDLKEAFDNILREKPQALVAAPTGLLYTYRREVVEFAAKNRLPTVYGLREPVVDGGLISLITDLFAIAARGAFYVDRIFKGAKPGDLPVEQPTRFELVINLKTAKALGLRIPPSLLQRADQVIE
jgi:putative ABC transport system substrate-binding protein